MVWQTSVNGLDRTACTAFAPSEGDIRALAIFGYEELEELAGLEVRERGSSVP